MFRGTLSSRDIDSTILILTLLKDGGFFLHPARLRIFCWERRVKAGCPEAFSSEDDVSLCLRVHVNAFKGCAERLCFHCSRSKLLCLSLSAAIAVLTTRSDES